MDKTALNVLIPVDLKESFKTHAQSEYKNITGKIIELMVNYVKEMDKK